MKIVKRVKKILDEKQVPHHLNHGITFTIVTSQSSGSQIAKEILYWLVDLQTVLYLSGGRTPKELYAGIAKEEKIIPGAVGMIDERFGPKWHKESNELMMQETGLVRYLQMRDIPFYPVLKGKIHQSRHSGERSDSRISLVSNTERFWTSQNDDNGNLREDTADTYDQDIRKLHSIFPKSIGILGIGLDGHTAGIPASTSLGLQGDALRSWMRDVLERVKHSMVVDYDNPTGFYKERITMTFLGLSMLDFLIVLVFGDDKKEALRLMFSDGSEEEVPSRFFKRPDIAQKTLLITDQQV